MCFLCDWDWQVKTPMREILSSLILEVIIWNCWVFFVFSSLGGHGAFTNYHWSATVSLHQIILYFQQASEEDWTSLLDDVWHTTGSWGRSNSISASRTFSRPGVLQSNSTSGDGRWLSAFLGQSPSSLYGSLWVSLRCWLASSGDHACPPYACVCAPLLHMES